MTNPLTDAVWAARGPSILTRKPGDDRPPRVDPNQEEQTPKKPRPMVPGCANTLALDVDGIVEMRRQGYEWKAIAAAHGCSVTTCRERVSKVEPALMAVMRRGSASPKVKEAKR